MDPVEPRDHLEPRDLHGRPGPNDAPLGNPGDPGTAGVPLPNPAGLRDPHPDPSPDDEELRHRDELADRSAAGSPSPAGRDRSDLVTGGEPPELPM